MILLKAPAIKTCGKSTIFSSSDPNEICNKFKFKILLREKQAGNNSIIVDEESNAIADKLLEYKWISTKQHKNLLNKC